MAELVADYPPAAPVLMIMPKDRKQETFNELLPSVTRMPDPNVVIPTVRRKPALHTPATGDTAPAGAAPFAGEESADLTAGDTLRYMKPGVQKKAFARLRRGRYPIEEHLDLHGMTINVAQRELAAFIAECGRRGMCAVKIIHGKGLSTADRRAVLKNKINEWLPGFDSVLAFCSAPDNDGGTGAVYVLLKKTRRC